MCVYYHIQGGKKWLDEHKTIRQKYGPVENYLGGDVTAI